jgi:4-hydroxybenzoate polyprenyltransferase
MPSPADLNLKQVVPLCVDLDGTVIKTDLLWEYFVRLLKQSPVSLFLIPFWWLRGRAFLKAQLARRVRIDVGSLPYCQPLLDFLQAEKMKGRPILLVTASDARMAQGIADHLSLFTEVLASDGTTNLRGKTKGARLAERFGEGGFDYAGNSSVDLPVWQRAREAIVVNGYASLTVRAKRCANVAHVLGNRRLLKRGVLEVLRPHQWVKNIIVFVPLLTSHHLTDWPLAWKGVLAFLAFSLCASAVYILNDLFDLDADRHHPVKRARPFASGELGLPVGLVIFPILLGASGVIASRLPLGFATALGIYIALSALYSWRVKEIPLLDVFCLAGLYTIRLIAGHEAPRVAYSFWLLVFSMFIFLSLALVKRFVEVTSARRQRGERVQGRGYSAEDVEFVATLGPSSGYLAVLVLALYVNSQEVRKLYENPTLLLFVCPLLLYWISRIWFLAHRGQMHSDPIVFALRDRASYVVGALTLAILWLATGHQ